MQSLGDYISLIDLVDIVALVVIAISMVLAARRGLADELAGTVSAVAGFILGAALFTPVVGWICDNSRLGQQSARIVAFVAIFLVVFAIMLALRIGLRVLLKVAIDKKTDRWGGAMAGMVKATVIVLAVFMAMIMSPFEKARTMFGENSLTGTLLIKAIPELAGGTPGIEEGDGEVIRLLDGEAD